MKQFYVCEKCGTQYESYDEAYTCEESHVCVTTIGFDMELAPFATWKKDNVPLFQNQRLLLKNHLSYQPLAQTLIHCKG